MNLNKETGNEGKRPVPATKIANLKRKMDGAERRVHRLETELVEIRSIIRRKYLVIAGGDGAPDQQDQLGAAQIAGYRLKRTEVEGQLIEAQGDYVIARRAYEEAVKRNTVLSRRQNHEMRKQNRAVREAKKLLRDTKSLLEKHGSNGGEKDVVELKSLAKAGDITGFRKVFDEKVRVWDEEHYATVSGVSTVKTEIIRELMEQFKSDSGSSGTITDLNI